MTIPGLALRGDPRRFQRGPMRDSSRASMDPTPRCGPHRCTRQTTHGLSLRCRAKARRVDRVKWAGLLRSCRPARGLSSPRKKKEPMPEYVPAIELARSVQCCMTLGGWSRADTKHGSHRVVPWPAGTLGFASPAFQRSATPRQDPDSWLRFTRTELQNHPQMRASIEDHAAPDKDQVLPREPITHRPSPPRRVSSHAFTQGLEPVRQCYPEG